MKKPKKNSSQPKPKPSSDYDTPWKEALELFLEELFEFFFLEAWVAIDWAKGYELLNTELQEIMQETETGRRFADQLAKVWLKNGQEQWLLIHIEVQSQYEADFAKRMYIYNHRLFDKYNKEVISFAILGDDHPHWRDNQYGYQRWGFSSHLVFPVVKILDFASNMNMLETNSNIFAMVVMAHLLTQATINEPDRRLAFKKQLLNLLYARGYDRKKTYQLLKFLDWLMVLPEELKQEFKAEYKRLEEEKRMPYVTTWEREAKAEGLEEGRTQGVQQGIQQGIQQGVQQGESVLILRLLKRRFGTIKSKIKRQIQNLSIPQLESLGDALLDFTQVSDLTNWLNQNTRD